MGLYSERVFPWLCDRMMDDRVLRRVRLEVLAPAAGQGLEIGFGTGLNLPLYPAAVTGLTTVDVSAGMHRRAAARVAASPIPVAHRQLTAERLPFADDSFDFAVCTWTLCSIPDPAAALTELRRVLRPGSSLLYVEHGLAPDADVATWQRRLNPLQRCFACGCNLNRDIAALIAASGLTPQAPRAYYLETMPRFAGYTYQGAARK
jgi:ubiquinone/menaquinone biosynthesis C-methylase UbiE